MYSLLEGISMNMTRILTLAFFLNASHIIAGPYDQLNPADQVNAALTSAFLQKGTELIQQGALNIQNANKQDSIESARILRTAGREQITQGAVYCVAPIFTLQLNPADQANALTSAFLQTGTGLIEQGALNIQNANKQDSIENTENARILRRAGREQITRGTIYCFTPMFTLMALIAQQN